MDRKAVRVDITLVFETPPSIGAAGAFSSIADRVAERNARGAFIIPGSQVKGKLRHACEQLLRGVRVPICESPRAETMCPNRPDNDSLCEVCRIFGCPAVSSRFSFHDLTLQVDHGRGDGEIMVPSLRTMIGINRRRQTTAEERLFFVETAPHFRELQFGNNNAITGGSDDERQVRLLVAALGLITAWGGVKSRGLGWIGGLKVTAYFDGKPIEATRWANGERWWFSTP